VHFEKINKRHSAPPKTDANKNFIRMNNLKQTLINDILALNDKKHNSTIFIAFTPPTRQQLDKLTVQQLEALKKDLTDALNKKDLESRQKQYSQLNGQIQGFKDEKPNFKII
jgi:hypothetical protein